jgi:hypothetical protein
LSLAGLLVGLALLLGLAAGPAAAAAKDDRLAGTWSISVALVSSEVIGPGAASLQDPFKGLDATTTATITCSGLTCVLSESLLTAPNGETTTELLRRGPELDIWEGFESWAKSGPCTQQNSKLIRLLPSGTGFSGEIHVQIGSSSLIQDGQGACIAPQTAYTAIAVFSVTGSATGSESAGSVTGRSTGETAELTARQAASSAALEARDRSSLAAALVTPTEAFDEVGHTAQNALLAGLAVLLLVFPSQLFNATWEKHHDRVTAVITRLRPGRRDDPSVPGAAVAPTSTGTRSFAMVAVAGAVLGGFLDPAFGLDLASVALVAGVLASIVVTTALSGLVGSRYRRSHKLQASGALRAVPVGLAIAAASVVVSRAVGFRPGYLYGLVGGFAFVGSLKTRDAGRSEMTSIAAGLGLALLAWFAFVPVSDAANSSDPVFLVRLLDPFLAALVIGGIEGLLFSLVPLQFLPGHRVARWSWKAWATVTTVVAFVFVSVLLRPSSGYLGASSTASVVVTYGLFAAFGLASVAFWGWFRLHPEPVLVPAEVDVS